MPRLRVHGLLGFLEDFLDLLNPNITALGYQLEGLYTPPIYFSIQKINFKEIFLTLKGTVYIISTRRKTVQIHKGTF